MTSRPHGRSWCWPPSFRRALHIMGAALERADAPPAVEQEPQSLPEQVEDLVGDSGGGGPISPALQDAQPSAEETP